MPIIRIERETAPQSGNHIRDTRDETVWRELRICILIMWCAVDLIGDCLKMYRTPLITRKKVPDTFNSPGQSSTHENATGPGTEDVAGCADVTYTRCLTMFKGLDKGHIWECLLLPGETTINMGTHDECPTE